MSSLKTIKPKLSNINGDIMHNYSNKRKEIIPPEGKKLFNKLSILKRTTWIPQVKEGDGSVFASKFSGIPWLEKSEEWPVCPNCKKPMQLFVQLNLAELPELPKGCQSEGLIQFFYCTLFEPNCGIDCVTFSPGSKSLILRIVQPKGKANKIDITSITNAFPPKLITGWEKMFDYPNWEECKKHKIILTDEDCMLLENFELPVSGEKLMGWPAWFQGVEYPTCPACGAQMNLVFQIDSENNIPYTFGEDGRGYITQCAKHPDNLAFTWDCIG